MVEESNQNVFLMQIDASSFAEFEISEFEITRFYCIYLMVQTLTRSLLIHRLHRIDQCVCPIQWQSGLILNAIYIHINTKC